MFDKAAFDIGKKRFKDIEQFIGDRYASEHGDSMSVMMQRRRAHNASLAFDACYAECDAALEKSEKEASLLKPHAKQNAKPSLLKPHAKQNAKPSISNIGRAIDELMDESFSEMLIRKNDERGMSDAECYKRANIDRKLFSKIRSDRLYKPSKPTVIAFAIALELDIDETKNMLMKAGFALSHSNKFDLIIEYFIDRGIYDVLEINDALFAFDQQLLGA